MKSVSYNTTWISPKELAYDLSLSYKTIIKFIKSGKIKAYKIGRHYKINPVDIQNFINQNIIKQKYYID